jgi:protease IV
MTRPLGPRLALPALAVTLAVIGARLSAGDLLPPLLELKSVAAADGAAGFFVNPATGGVRYPSELLLGWSDQRGGGDAYLAAASWEGFGVGIHHQDQGVTAALAGLRAGGAGLRLGLTHAWLRAPGGSRATDLALGLSSRPSPWLSLGVRADHLAEPRFQGRRLDRGYTVGIGVRPLALVPAAAFELGPRLALTADLLRREDDPPERSVARFGAECELVDGLALRGQVERGGAWRLGFSLLGLTRGLHAQAGWDQHGERRLTGGALSMHGGEDRTVLATAAARRVALVRVAGELGDEEQAGFSPLGGGGGTVVEPIHHELERALEDPLTRGVLLELDGASNMAQLEELRPRIARLRAAGKPVVAWLEEGGGRGDLLLASACDRIVTTPEAAFAALGLRVERRYYRRLLADWGLTIDRSSFGRYKSAYRGFSADSTPPADREAIEHNLDVSQELFVGAVGADRRLERARLLAVLDGRWWPPEDLQRLGVVDSVGYREDALRLLGRLSGLGDEPRACVPEAGVQARRAWTVPRPIAVVYASGAITTGDSGWDLWDGTTLGARTLIGQLESAFEDRGIRAVVLRIESPGGSALASDLIHHATVRLKRQHPKPFIVSMGGVAASGGYHIAVHGDRIFADRFTRTGSIGVVFLKPSVERWLSEHRVRQDAFERGPYMRGASLGRDWDARIQAHADSMVRQSHDRFVTQVALGRRLGRDAVQAAAQGRVWMGDDARARALVDSIGGLAEAVAEARRRAGIAPEEKIGVAAFRRPQAGLMQRLLGRGLLSWARSALPVRDSDPGDLEYRADVGEEP